MLNCVYEVLKAHQRALAADEREKLRLAMETKRQDRQAAAEARKAAAAPRRAEAAVRKQQRLVEAEAKKAQEAVPAPATRRHRQETFDQRGYMKKYRAWIKREREVAPPDHLARLLEKCSKIDRGETIARGECYVAMREIVDAGWAGRETDGKAWTWNRWNLAYVVDHSLPRKEVSRCIEDYEATRMAADLDAAQ
jgi:hypothetical protein